VSDMVQNFSASVLCSALILSLDNTEVFAGLKTVLNSQHSLFNHVVKTLVFTYSDIACIYFFLLK